MVGAKCITVHIAQCVRVVTKGAEARPRPRLAAAAYSAGGTIFSTTPVLPPVPPLPLAIT
jgi:hypothetical protein